ncbi:hypothetical protein SBOR_9896 [Sclerotinia borealis F-4128]|uniref:Uncharacterized protein n=1 Tax=Sclerotinia borealis (strain F-4128) TaxID=1432307 RepID=W9C561_SCLBF|nr:hypothetical protein SBOR_9896 [Sclerotinia borealis F-4128]
MTILLLIGNSITTTLQYQAVATINQYGKAVGIAGYRGTGLLVLIWTAFEVACVATGTWGWGVWINGGKDDSSEDTENRGAYKIWVKDPVKLEIGEPVRLAVRRGRVVEVDGEGRSMELELDYVRESQVGLAL